jgi:hypothetical protein
MNKPLHTMNKFVDVVMGNYLMSRSDAMGGSNSPGSNDSSSDEISGSDFYRIAVSEPRPMLLNREIVDFFRKISTCFREFIDLKIIPFCCANITSNTILFFVPRETIINDSSGVLFIIDQKLHVKWYYVGIYSHAFIKNHLRLDEPRFGMILSKDEFGSFIHKIVFDTDGLNSCMTIIERVFNGVNELETTESIQPRTPSLDTSQVSQNGWALSRGRGAVDRSGGAL